MGETSGRRTGRIVLIVVVMSLAGAAGIVASWAGGGGRGVRAFLAAQGTGPCAYVPIDVAEYGGAELENPPEWTPENGVLKKRLRVAFTKRSDTEIAGCPVRLRSFNRKLVGPTMRVRPGDDLAPVLVNRLPVESTAQVRKQRRQQTSQAHVAVKPNAYNTTNLHFHGLHVSPRGNGDNVLLAIPPQTKQAYEVEIPDDHPSGTFWYHPHGHGSTAIHVGSGMAGAIVIEDDPKKIPPALAAANEREKVMVFQTILYDAKGKSQNIKSFFPDSPTPTAQPSPCVNARPTCAWFGSHRRTTINGQIVPTISMQPGEVQRWRMVGGAFRELIELRLEGHELHEIALDGLYLGRVDTWAADDDKQTIALGPGYRSDVLVQAGDEGTYDLIDESEPDSLRGVDEQRRVVARVVVGGEPLDMNLPTDEEMAPLAPFPGVDLRFEAEGVQIAQFRLAGDRVGATPATSPLPVPTPSPLPSLPDERSKTYFQINGEAFDPHRVRRLALGTVDVWNLSTVGDPPGLGDGGIPPLDHVFHIHVNPFQYVREGPDGPELVWKDTVVVPATNTPEDVVNVYTKYTDFTGRFVIHCHILDHEDLGMMQVVKVVRPAALVRKLPHETPGH